MNIVYAFCRKSDDIVDNENKTLDERENELETWKNELTRAFNNNAENPLLAELMECVIEFNIPKQPFFDLIDGMAIDLKKNRFETFEDLKDYCYKAASTVGLMTIPIFGYQDEKTVDFAINLGIALQLTNIIRDVNTDYKNDRIYLPKEDFEKFQYSEKELSDGIINSNFINLMKFQETRARDYYKKANHNLVAKDKSSMFAARAMQSIYSKLLDKIVKENYNIFEKPIRISTSRKLLISLGYLIKHKLHK